MKLFVAFFLLYAFTACNYTKKEIPGNHSSIVPVMPRLKPYKEVKENIVLKRKTFASSCRQVKQLNTATIEAITDFWVNSISNDLYASWQLTRWDFNGTAGEPGTGPIACGYFVATILRDMDCRINRFKVGILPSSGIMKAVAPHQKIKNLSKLSYPAFNDSLTTFGKGVYIIGLDFHVGLIVNDGTANWFIHSNYIHKRGVTKEPVLASAALKSSKTRWIISLTGDKDFLNRWLRG